MTGSDPASAYAAITSDTDFRLFKLRVRADYAIAGSTGAIWYVHTVRVDMDNDGTWELQTSSGLSVVSYMYPEPLTFSTTRTIRVEVQFADVNGRTEDDWRRTLYCDVMVIAAPRVYANAAGDAVVQLQNEDCTAYKPVVIVDGFDPQNELFPENYYRLLQEIIDVDLRSGLGYEVFILNFADGGRDLRFNAAVVLAALEKVHEICPSYQICLVGLSMGGLISRYALARAESEHTAHNVGLFVSFDAPQQQANVNPDLQDWIMSQAPTGAVGRWQERLQSVAAKQMLGYNTYDPTHTYHDALFHDLRALNGDGYPHKSYNVAVSNGNFSATWGYGMVGRRMATLKVFLNGGLLTYHNMLAEQLDVATGSMMSNIAGRQIGSILHNPLLDYYYELEVLYNPVYQPTWSTLDLQQPFVIDTLTGDITSYTRAMFDEFLVQTRPIMHHETSALSRSQLQSWLNKSFDLTISYDLTDGGSVNPVTYHVPVLGNTPITILPQTVMVSGREITYEFVQWDDGSRENPRQLYPWRDVSRSTIMKVRLASTSPGATWGSGQRRIAAVSDVSDGSTYHAVYESGGRIWHARNPHNAGWELDRLISADDAADAQDPTITTEVLSNGQVQVHAAWLRSPTGPIVYRAGDATNGLTWMAPVEHQVGGEHRAVLLPDPRCDAPGAPYPCWPVLLWVDGGCGDELCPPGVYYMKSPRESGAYHLVPGADGNVSAAAAVYSEDCPPGYREIGTGYRLAFVRDGRIYSGSFKDPGPLFPEVPPEPCNGPDELTSPGWTAANPSMVSSGTDVFVAWEESYGGSRRIAFKQRSGGIWSSTVYFTHSTHVPTKPVLGIEYSCGRVNLLWQCSDHIALVSRALSGSVWAPVADLGPGRAPSMVAAEPAGASAMWTSGLAAPYSIHLSNTITSPRPTTDVGSDVFSDTEVWLTWTAPGEGTGAAVEYDLRYALWPITEGNWGISPRAWGAPAPGAPGSPEGYAITGLEACTPYWFALKSKDGCGNWSPISNVFAGGTLCWGGGGGWYRARPAGPIALTSDEGTAIEGPSDRESAAAGAAQTHSATTNQGDALAVEMQIEGDSVVWRAYLIDSVSVPNAVGSDSVGIYFQARGEEGWSSWARYVPSAPNTHFGVRSLWNQGRAVFVGPYTLEDTSNGNAVGSRVRSESSREDELAMALVDTLTVSHLGGSGTKRSQDWYVLIRSVAGPAPGHHGLTPPPKAFALRQNQPNPFSSRTTIRFDLPIETSVRLVIFDAQGRVVRRLVNGRVPAGFQSVEWDKRDNGGRQVGSGVYLYRIQAGSFRAQKKMVLLP
jgi:hypothetical protein